jgi:hypothetical protein
MRFVRRGILAAVFVLISAVLLMGTQAQEVMACWQFSTWEEAQATHLAYPWMGLDEDGDGIACQCLIDGVPCP